MDTGPAAENPSPRRPRTTGPALAAAVLFLAVWIPLHPARPPQPTADVTTHLSVARHLLRGEGFRTDITYPLSFAFDFARELPQPLIHRQPGFALLLTGPVAAAGLDPGRAIRYARLLQVGLLGLVILVGAAALWRRGKAGAVPPWLILVGANPLMAYAVDWVFVELAAGLVMFGLWLRSRDGDAPGPLDGLLAGLLFLLRLDLVWVPLFWWIADRRPRRTGWRRPALALAVAAVVAAPWIARNVAVTGRPFFSLQAYAEQVKDTRAWPGYSVYRQLEVQPLVPTLLHDPEPVLRKTGRGVRFFLEDLPRFAPLPLLLVFAVGLVLAPFRRGIADSGGGGRAGPRAVAGLTLALLVVQYSVFDHSLRHLLVLLPILAWEGALFTAEALPGARGAVPALAAIAAVLLFPCRLPGWRTAAADAVAALPETEARLERFRRRDDAVLFVPDGTIPWYLDRPAVWDPGDEETRETIRRLLAAPGTGP